MKNLVSIVVPVYNMGDSINVCVQSLIKQSYKEIEIILVDDGSTDNSLQECYRLSEIDSRIRVFHTENQGSGPARNYGISKAEGRYICFPDADDLYNENAIEVMLLGMNNGKNDFVIAGYKSVDAHGSVVAQRTYTDKIVEGNDLRKNYHKYIGDEEKFGINGAPWNKLYNLEIIRENKIEFPALRRHQDTAFIFLYLCKVKRVYFINQGVYIHYVNDLRKEWDKYPINYIESVIGLRKIQEQTVLKWNLFNKDVVEKINQGYISNIIKAVELSLSSKFKLNAEEKVVYIKKVVESSNLLSIKIPSCLGWYQSLILQKIKKEQYVQLLLILKCKIILEKHGGVILIKKLIKNLRSR